MCFNKIRVSYNNIFWGLMTKGMMKNLNLRGLKRGLFGSSKCLCVGLCVLVECNNSCLMRKYDALPTPEMAQM